MTVLPENAKDLLEELKEHVGAEKILDEFAEAMDSWDLADFLEYICSILDYDYEDVEEDKNE